MTALPPDRRRYGDDDIARILRRAAEFQRATPSRPDPSGLTLAELEEIALEAGIDPENLRRAAAEVGRGPAESDLVTTLLGAPLAYRLEDVIPGELAHERFGELVPIIQNGTGVVGQATTVGSTLNWMSIGGTQHQRPLQVMVTVAGGETRVAIEERSGQVAAAFHAGFGAGGSGVALPMGMLVGSTAGAIPGVAVGIGLGALFYGIGRTLFKITTGKRKRKLDALFIELTDRIRAFIAQDDAAALPSTPDRALPAAEAPGAANDERGLPPG